MASNDGKSDIYGQAPRLHLQRTGHVVPASPEIHEDRDSISGNENGSVISFGDFVSLSFRAAQAARPPLVLRARYNVTANDLKDVHGPAGNGGPFALTKKKRGRQLWERRP